MNEKQQAREKAHWASIRRALEAQGATVEGGLTEGSLRRVNGFHVSIEIREVGPHWDRSGKLQVVVRDSYIDGAPKTAYFKERKNGSIAIDRVIARIMREVNFMQRKADSDAEREAKRSLVHKKMERLQALADKFEHGQGLHDGHDVRKRWGGHGAYVVDKGLSVSFSGLTEDQARVLLTAALNAGVKVKQPEPEEVEAKDAWSRLA